MVLPFSCYIKCEHIFGTMNYWQDDFPLSVHPEVDEQRTKVGRDRPKATRVLIKGATWKARETRSGFAFRPGSCCLSSLSSSNPLTGPTLRPPQPRTNDR